MIESKIFIVKKIARFTGKKNHRYMKVVIGHKVLNLEELTHVACLGKDLAEVIVDS